ncbi:hypothetical protein D3C76_1206010 [compost metagenome]
MQTLEVCHFRSISSFSQSFETCFDQCAYTTAKYSLFSEQICFSLFTERSFNNPCTSTANTFCISKTNFFSFAGSILMNSDQTWNPETFFISTANHVSWGFWSYEQYVIVSRRNDLTEMNVKAVRKKKCCAFFQVRSDFAIVYRSLCFVWHKNLNYVSTFCSFCYGQHFKAIFFSFIEGFTFTKTDNYIYSAITQVLSMSMTLATITDNCDCFTF